jgi:hypothetical protein
VRSVCAKVGVPVLGCANAYQATYRPRSMAKAITLNKDTTLRSNRKGRRRNPSGIVRTIVICCLIGLRTFLSGEPLKRKSQERPYPFLKLAYGPGETLTDGLTSIQTHAR